MSEVTTDDMNEVIAIFDGWELQDDGEGVDQLVKNHKTKYHFELKYHESWDALMPVVKKIRGMHMDILKAVGVGEYMHAAAPVNSALLDIDVQKMHKAVYQFIIWLNQQTTTNEKEI